MQTNPNSPFASVVGLGPLKSEHTLSGKSKWSGLGCGLILLIGAPVLGLAAAVVAYDDLNRRGQLHMFDNAGPLLLIAGIIFLISLPVLYNAWRNWGLAAALYENGLAYNDRKGVQQVRWDQMEAVWQSVTKHYTNGIYTGTTHLYTIQAQGGVKIRLDDKLAKVEDLGREIQRGVAVTLFPRYVQALQSGQRVTFGPLALDTGKLYSGKKELAWSEIKAIKINRGIISIKKEKGWFNWASVTVPQIPNFYVFWELVSRFAKTE